MAQRQGLLRRQRRSLAYQEGWWILATTLAGALVGALESGGLQFLSTLVLTGLFLGIGQWLVLRPYLINASLWIVASFSGWVAGSYLMINSAAILDPIVSFLWQLGGWEVLWLNLVKQPVAILVLGIAQWVVLRRSFPNAHWWIVASLAGGLLNGGIGASVCYVACEPLTRSIGAVVATAIAYGAGWASYAAITGLVLRYLL
jgi:hypothetical protein